MFSWIVFIAMLGPAIAFLCGRFTANYAAERGRSKRAWFLVGSLLFLLFPIPGMVLGVLPKKQGGKT